MSSDPFDVIIIGGGVAGASAAYHLAKEKRVLLLEQFPFLHKRGSSHGGSRIFRHAYEDARYVALAVAADALWEALERDAGDKLLYRTGGLDIGPADSEDLDAIEKALAKVGRSVEKLSAAEAGGRFPAFHLPSTDIALYQPDAGILAATRCVNAMLRLAAARGASLRDNEPVRHFEARPNHVRVTTSKAGYEASQLVITAGAWLAEIVEELALPIYIQQQQVLYVGVADGQTHALGKMPIFINRSPEAEVYGFPLFDHPSAIKISNHAGAPTIRLSERQDELMKARAEDTLKRARRFLPGITGELIDYELCLYTKTPDEHFILDRHPEHANVVIGGGFSGHGFKFGAVLGEVIKGLLEGNANHELSLFDSKRFATHMTGS